MVVILLTFQLLKSAFERRHFQNIRVTLVALLRLGASVAVILVRLVHPLKAASILVQAQVPQFLISNNFNASLELLKDILPVVAVTATS